MNHRVTHGMTDTPAYKSERDKGKSKHCSRQCYYDSLRKENK